MNHKCWNCGQDLDVPETDIRAAERNRIATRLEDMARVYRATGNGIRYEVYSDAAQLARANGR